MRRILTKLLPELVMPAVMIAAWVFFLMLYFEVVPPSVGFIRWLMPWTEIFAVPASYGFGERISHLQSLLDRSVIIVNIGLALMVMSVAALAVSATYAYQQRQRRMRENELLVIKNSEIARRSEFIRYISATISHEFKNNLGRIKRRLGFLDIPLDDRERLDINMDRLFTDIDIFKKISDEREAGLVEFERTDLRAMLNDMAEQHSDLVAFSLSFEIDSPTVVASRTLIRTVFENLVDNAIKYKKPGQVRAEVHIRVTHDSDGPRRYVSVSFADEGVGMDEETAERCFYSKTQSASSGWGEGLYFVKYVVGLHAGKVRVGKEYTAPGIGTEFIVKLPHLTEEDADV